MEGELAIGHWIAAARALGINKGVGNRRIIDVGMVAHAICHGNELVIARGQSATIDAQFLNGGRICACDVTAIAQNLRLANAREVAEQEVRSHRAVFVIIERDTLYLRQ